MRVVLPVVAVVAVIAVIFYLTVSSQPVPNATSGPVAKTSPASNAKSESNAKSDAPVPFDFEGKATTTASGLKYFDEKVGDGREAKPGDTVVVHYTGTFRDRRKFDSSRDGGEPLSFRLGARKVIRGWDEGIQGMKVGGKRRLIIPPDLGYGASGYPPDIPPNTELHFEVELLDIK